MDQLTPSQSRWMQEAKERRARIAAKAKPDKPLECLSASQRAASFEPPKLTLLPEHPAPTVEQWVERQIQIYRPWFHIEDEIEAPVKQAPSVNLIQRITAKHFGVSVTDILSSRRNVRVVRPRQVAIYLTKTMTPRSMPEIGRRFGDRDHTTVLWAVRKIGALMESDPSLKAKVEAIAEEIREAC